jgi:hypothetical protein
LGCLITARAQGSGKVVLSGPSDSVWLQEMIAAMRNYEVNVTLVDGALSRMSLASPAVTEAMILCTGAACSAQLPELIRQTKFRCSLIDLPQVSSSLYNLLFPLNNGVWLLTDKDRTIKKIADTVFTFGNDLELSDNLIIYVAGAVTDSFLKSLYMRTHGKISLVVRDFSKLFVSMQTYDRFVRKGGNITVLQKAKLAAVCTNPVSPEGACLNPIMLKEQMQEALQLPVYDIVQIMNNVRVNLRVRPINNLPVAE